MANVFGHYNKPSASMKIADGKPAYYNCIFKARCLPDDTIPPIAKLPYRRK